MSAQSNASPAIIKRKKVVSGGGHHGGAWKVAYADFVTAMMAFFLLMWLLNATTETQRKGVADYFSPTVPLFRSAGGGHGSFSGDSIFSEDTLPQNGTGATLEHAAEKRQARGDVEITPAASDGDAGDVLQMRKIEEALAGFGGESRAAKENLEHIVTKVTDEGLVVEVFDEGGRTLFDRESDRPTALLRELADVLVEVSGIVTNSMALAAHTQAKPIVLAENPVWALSAARADQFRRLLETRGIHPARIKRITGHADKSPSMENPMDVRNNRLQLIFLREDT